MNTETQTSLELVRLSDGQTGLRSTLEIDVREAPAGASDPSTISHQPSTTLDFVASSATLDRYHEVIEPAGWRLNTYARNPVFQNAHNYGDIIFTLGKALVTEVRSGAGGEAFLFQRIEFATDVNPMARIAYGLYRGGFLRAVSVGFVPLRWENGAPDSAWRRKYLEQELLEVSAVAIPANPDALALGLKAGAVRKGDVTEALGLVRLALEEGQKCGTRVRAGQLMEFARCLHRIMRA